MSVAPGKPGWQAALSEAVAAPPLPSAVRALVRALWGYVIPALLAGLTLKFLVPMAGVGLHGWIASAGRWPVPFLAGLFVLYAALAQYWRFHLPGGRHASALPSHCATGERDPLRLRRWAEAAQAARDLSRQRLASIDGKTASELEPVGRALATAMAGGDLEGALAAAEAAQALVNPVSTSRVLYQAVVASVAGVSIVGAVLLVRAKVAEPFVVLSTSMMPTLEVGDRIAANKLAYRGASGGLPARADAIAFRSAAVALGNNAVVPDVLIKRVIGLPGDRIEMHDGTPVINGWEVPSCAAGNLLYVLPDGMGDTLRGLVRVEFLDDRAYLVLHSVPMPEMRSPYDVRAGEVFVLGDNRTNSLDSRVWNDRRGGGVPLAAIDGRAQWFLTGTHRSGDTDLDRLLRPLDALSGKLRLEGVNADQLTQGIARCMSERPESTIPPAPSGARAAGAS